MRRWGWLLPLWGAGARVPRGVTVSLQPPSFPGGTCEPAPRTRQGPLLCFPGYVGAVVRAGKGLSPWQGRQAGVGVHWGRSELLCPWGRSLACCKHSWDQLPCCLVHSLGCHQAQEGLCTGARVRAQRSGAGERASFKRYPCGMLTPQDPVLAQGALVLPLALPWLISVCCRV